MEIENQTIRIPGITELEKLELEKQIDKQYLEFKSPTLDEHQYGELATATAVVIITLSVVKAISAWLLKTQTKNRINRIIEIEHPDGRKETHTINLDLSSSTSPNEDVLKALGSMLNIDPALLV